VQELKQEVKAVVPEPQTKSTGNTNAPKVNEQNTNSSSRLFLTPLVRKQFESKINEVQSLWNGGWRGTGPQGRIVKKDIDTLNSALASQTSNNSTSTTSTTTNSTSKANENIYQSTNILSHASLNDDQILTREDFINLRRQWNTESKKNVPQ